MQFQRVKGTRDVYPPESIIREELEKRAIGILKNAGFKPIRIPTFEHTELYLRSTGETSDIVIKEMYTFKDKGGRSLTLRPEGTPGVIRAIIENNLKIPARFYYIASMFRQERPQKGRLREHYQIGVEVVGEKEPEVDAELIYIGKKILETLNVKDLKVEINSVGCPGCREEFKKNLLKYLEDKRDKLCDDCKRRLSTNPLRVFDCKKSSCQKVYEKSPKITQYLCEECKSHFEGVKKALSFLGIEFFLNPKLVRGLDYYTRTVFEIKSNKLGAQNTVLAGGRYDNMFCELGGNPTPAIGFAFGEERVILASEGIEYKEKNFLYIIPLGEEAIKIALDFLKKIREKNINSLVDYSLKKLSSKLKKADRLGARYVLIIGEDEIDKKEALLRDMNTGKQVWIPFKKLVKHLETLDL